jgi:hypothetical protein
LTQDKRYGFIQKAINDANDGDEIKVYHGIYYKAIRLYSSGSTGKTTAEMQTASTFLDTDWNFVGETANGTEDIWWILEGKDYPRLWWEDNNN